MYTNLTQKLIRIDSFGFSRCLKGLKGLPAIPQVQAILSALAGQMNQSVERCLNETGSSILKEVNGSLFFLPPPKDSKTKICSKRDPKEQYETHNGVNLK